MNQIYYYLHFENKPSFVELDQLFQKCMTYQPVLYSSYLISIDQDEISPKTAKELVLDCFQRACFVLCRLYKTQIECFRESHYVVGVPGLSP